MARALTLDVGGTSTRCGLFRDNGRLALVSSAQLRTQDFTSFAALLEAIRQSAIGKELHDLDAVTAAAAGPITNGICRLPNVPWEIDSAVLQSAFPGARTALINDFLAVSYSILTPVRDSAIPILDGTPQPGSPVAVLGAGTGFGKAAILPPALPSEGGHTNFPAQGEREWKYVEFLRERIPAAAGSSYVSWEDVLSGRGLSSLHEFLTGDHLNPAAVGQLLTPDSETLVWFARFYGRAARNFALEILARGGVFIAGGVAEKNPPIVTHPAFAHEFRSPRTHADILAEIPVWLLTSDQAGLWGAAYYGMNDRKQL